MPIGDLHKRKRKTNLAILTAIGGWIILIFIVTMVKMGAGS
jgi:hypothetical protein